MTTTPPAPQHDGPAARPSMRGLLRAGTLAGLVAAVATSALAGIAQAADVALEVDGRPIPVLAFALWTVIGAGLGIALARVLRRRRRFVVTTAVATALSLVPAIALPDDTATKVVLVAAHLVAAAIIIPALARQLSSPGGS